MTTNANLLARRNAAVPRGVATATPVFGQSSHRIWLPDPTEYQSAGPSEAEAQVCQLKMSTPSFVWRA